MQKSLRKFTITTVVTAVLLCSAVALTGFGLNADRARADNSVSIEGYNLEPSYLIGTEITVPDVTLSCGGQSAEADAAVIVPGGDLYEKKTLSLDEMGVYRIVYSAVIGGATVTQEKRVEVYDKLYETSDKSSKTEYGAWEHTPDVSGILVDLMPGDTFKFNKILDISENTEDIDIVNMFMTPKTIGERDCGQVYVTLTDIYDEENTVTILAQDTEPSGWVPGDWSTINTYYLAGSAAQMMTGLEWNSPTTYKLHQNNGYGYAGYFSFHGTPGYGGVLGEQTLRFRMNYEERRVFGSPGSPNNPQLIADLDDSTYFSDLWNGFTTGEVYLSISCATYAKTSASFCITSINGLDLTDDSFIDTDAPVLTVDSGTYDLDDLPGGVVGLAYTVFPATAQDAYDGKVNVTARVYRNYGSSARTQVYIENGAFVPSKKGVYTIEYTATDNSGNTAVVLAEVKVTENNENPVSIIIEDKTAGDGVKVGNVVTVSNATLSGGNGETYMSVVAKLEGRDVSYELDDLTFRPEYYGTYTIVYTYGDLLEEKTESYSIEVAPNESAAFWEEADLPEYMISNCSYTIPELYAYTFDADGKHETASKIKVTLPGESEPVELNSTRLTPTGEGKMIITYYAGDTEKSYTVNVVDTGYGVKNGLKIYKYFVSSSELGFLPMAQSVEALGNEKETVVEFINELLGTDVSFKFNLDPEKTIPTSVEIRIYDAENPDMYIKAVYKMKDAENTVVIINDGNMQYTVGNPFDGKGRDQVFYYDNADRTIKLSDDSNVTAAVDTYYSIEKGGYVDGFDGFPSNRVRFEMRVVNDRGDGTAYGILMKNLNGQVLSNITNDYIKPSIGIPDTASKQYKLGDDIVVPSAIVMDVLDPDVTVNMWITDTKGNIAVSKDGQRMENLDVSKEYVLVADDYGGFTVYYEATDTAGRVASYSYVLRVTDDIAPTITVEGNMPTEGKAGEYVILPEITVTDNLSTENTLIVYLIKPDGTKIRMNGNSFLPQEAGVFTVRLYAYDDVYNSTYLDYRITIS